jgi:hypothetical protein
VKHLTKEWVRDDLITQREQRAIRRCAGHANHDDDDDDDDENNDGDDDDARPTKQVVASPVEMLSRP